MSHEEMDYQKLKGIPRFVIKDLNGNPVYIIEDLNPEKDFDRSRDIFDMLKEKKFSESAYSSLFTTNQKEQSKSDESESRVLHVSCKDIGLDCNYEGSGRNEEELMNNLLEHAIKIHGYKPEDKLDIEPQQDVKSQIYAPTKYTFKKDSKKIEQVYGYFHANEELKEVQQQFMTKVPPEVADFVLKLNIHQNEKHNLDLILQKVKDYFALEKIDYEIDMGIFSDPEFPASKDVEMKFKIKQDHETIKNRIKPKLYDLMEKFLPPELTNKILIDLEALRVK